MRHSVWHHAALAAGSSRRAARQREGCEARGRQAVRQTRDSGPRSQGPPRPTKQEINHLHLGGCFRNALLLLSVLHTLVNAMKPGNPRATSSAALRAASRSWGTGQRFCICRCRRSCTVRPGRGRTRNRPLARSNDNLLVAGCHFKAKIGLVHDRPPLRALRTMLITAEGRVVHQLDESYTSFLTWHPKWSWCCQAREGPLRDSRVRRRAGVAAPMGTTRSDGATAMKREAGECTADPHYSCYGNVHLHPFSYPASPHGPRNGPRGQGQARRAGGQAGWPRVARTRRFRSAGDAGSGLFGTARAGCMGWVGV